MSQRWKVFGAVGRIFKVCFGFNSSGLISDAGGVKGQVRPGQVTRLWLLPHMIVDKVGDGIRLLVQDHFISKQTLIFFTGNSNKRFGLISLQEVES